MLYDYNAEYTTKHSDTCYDEDLNSTGKIKQVNSVSGLNGRAVNAMASQSKGREEEFFIL